MEDKIVPYTDEWDSIANNKARGYCPPIYPCVHCGNPVISGYRCDCCGSSNPSGTEEQRYAFRKWVDEQKAKKAAKE